MAAYSPDIKPVDLNTVSGASDSALMLTLCALQMLVLLLLLLLLLLSRHFGSDAGSSLPHADTGRGRAAAQRDELVGRVL